MAKQLPVVAAGVTLSVDMVDCEIEGWVWPQSARRQEAAGKLRAILDSDGGLVGYQRIAKGPAMYRETVERTHSGVLPVMERSSASISPKEVMLYAGRHFKGGGSRTLGMSELQRASQKYSDLTMEQIARGRRIPAGKPPLEDAVERVIAKVERFERDRMVA